MLPAHKCGMDCSKGLGQGWKTSMDAACSSGDFRTVFGSPSVPTHVSYCSSPIRQLLVMGGILPPLTAHGCQLWLQ